jgi:hypothetical protein
MTNPSLLRWSGHGDRGARGSRRQAVAILAAANGRSSGGRAFVAAYHELRLFS